jgi:hypothetical protein
LAAYRLALVQILDAEGGKFLIAWKGFPLDEATWEPKACCDGCKVRMCV